LNNLSLIRIKMFSHSLMMRTAGQFFPSVSPPLHTDFKMLSLHCFYLHQPVAFHDRDASWGGFGVLYAIHDKEVIPNGQAAISRAKTASSDR
jgi:hypothetical protein